MADVDERIEIPFEERGLATLAHLSGLAGYIFPLGGIVVPIIIYLVKSESPTIRAIARQAILLNLTAFALICAGIVFFFTVLLIPAVILGWMVLAIAAVALPVIGAIRASEGRFYRYPVVGSNPERPLAASSVVS